MAGGENTIAWFSNCGALCLPGALDSPGGGKAEHTISIYMYLRSDGKVNREENPSSRRLLEPFDVSLAKESACLVFMD
jgi:hypothetical protein